MAARAVVALVALLTFTAEPRDHFRRPDVVVAALGIHDGDRVADVGAGDGYLTFRLAAAGARVTATDIDPWALMRLVVRGVGVAELCPRVTLRLTDRDDPGLERGAYQLVLLAQVDQYLRDRAGFFRALAVALAPGGRIIVVNKVAYDGPVRAAAAAAGLAVRTITADLQDQVMIELTPVPETSR